MLRRLLAASALAAALGGGGGRAHAQAGPSMADGEIVSSLQQPVPLPAPGGYAMAPDATPALIGRYGLTAKEVLLALAPHLAAVTLRPKSTETGGGGDVVHEEYELWFGPWRLDDAYLQLHHHKNRLAFLRAKLPEYRLPPEPPGAEEFLPLPSLGFEPRETGKESAVKVLAASSGFAAPAWELRHFDKLRGQTVMRVVDAQTGAVLREAESAFDAAQVYEKSPRDAALITVELPDLPATGYLDGKHFLVYAPAEGDPRVQAPDLKFDYRPDDPADALSFDQVEAYYAATKALAFFHDRFGYDIGAAQLKVRVNDLVSGRAENAAYVPPPEGPEIQIGKGGEHLSGLARDTDVVIHEFTHHVIFNHVTTSAGESGLFHEGTADYFAYAVNGDPYLGESVVTGGPYLRTAALDPTARIDAVPVTVDNHLRGQYWSAVLWELRQRIGADIFDKLVYESLAYMGPRSGMKDAFNALLNADRDLRPLPAGAVEAGVFGEDKCAIIQAGVARGFAVALEGQNGASCGLNLATLANESRALAKTVNESGGAKGRTVNVTIFGKKCSTIALDDPSEGAFALIWLLCLPVLVGLGTALFPGSTRGPHDHGP